MTSPQESRRPNSPSPPPPASSTPGPRASALQKLYKDAITHVLRTCSYPNFAACFPTPAKHVPSDLRDVHEQFISKLDHWLQHEFESILIERDVISSLNELDRLIEDARKRRAAALEQQQQQQNERQGGEAEDQHPPPQPIPPHTLPPTQLYLSHLAPTLGMYEAEMKAREEVLARENQTRLEKILKQRKQIEGLIGGLEKVVEDLRGSAEAMDPEEMGRLREEVKAVDEAMRA